MSTVEDFEEYTGVHGQVMIDDVAIAEAMYDVSWDRATLSHSVSGAYSKKNVPAEFSVKTKIKHYITYDNAPMMLGYSLSDTPVTGTAETLLAASHVLDASDWYEDMSDDTIATASRIRYTLQTKAITAGGTITVIGEDAAGNAITDILEVPDSMSIGEYLTTSKVFKKVYGHTIRGIDSTDDLGTFVVASITGSSTVSVGNPKVFDLVGRVNKGGEIVEITQPDCWFKNGGLAFEDAGKLVECDIDVEMHNPSALTKKVYTS